ncbi:hypothetical protein [Kaarinaea lacus]
MSIEVTSVKQSLVKHYRSYDYKGSISRLVFYGKNYLTLNNAKILLTAIAFVILMLGFVWYFANLVFSKPRQALVGEFSYDWFIEDFIKDMPAFKPLETARKQYYFNLISNAKIPANIVLYESQAPVDEVVSYYRLYFEILNYSFIRHRFDSEAMAIFRNTREQYTLFVEAQDNATLVTIEYYSRLH